MLSRRLIRIKVLQAVYAFYASGADRPDLKEKQLMESFSRMYDLFIYQLSFLTAVFDFAEKRIEENKKKHLPLPGDLEPNRRFIDNRVRKLLNENPVLNAEIRKRNVAWGAESEILLRFHALLKENPDYQAYLSGPDPTLKEDKEILDVVIIELMQHFNSLQYFFEEMHLQWVDDYYHVLGLTQRYIHGLRPGNSLSLPPLFKVEEDGSSEDKEFASLLFRRAAIKGVEWNELIAETAKNWELERIATMDMHILRMALCELTDFPSIPVKVTINEYIDISKYFSTPRSKTFINGMLDKLFHQLNDKGLIIKRGRGLMS